MSELANCPFCGDEGEKGRQTVTQMHDGNKFDRIICRCCGAMCPEQNWNQRANQKSEHQIIADFLERTGQYVTNDASREAAIADALAASLAKEKA